MELSEIVTRVERGGYEQAFAHKTKNADWRVYTQDYDCLYRVVLVSEEQDVLLTEIFKEEQEETTQNKIRGVLEEYVSEKEQKEKWKLSTTLCTTLGATVAIGFGYTMHDLNDPGVGILYAIGGAVGFICGFLPFIEYQEKKENNFESYKKRAFIATGDEALNIINPQKTEKTKKE